MAETIHQLAHKGDLKQLQVRILQNNNLLNETDESGRSVLHWAACGGHTNLVQWLIEHQANVDATDDALWTPLIIAASAGHEAVVRLLLGSGAEVNACTDQGRSSLLYACSRNRKEIALILLREGADPNLADKLGACPIHRAVGCGHTELTRLILNNANHLDVNKTDTYLNTSLHYAFEEGLGEICKLLINHGAKNDIRNKQGLTPLEMAKPELQRSFRQLLNSP